MKMLTLTATFAFLFSPAAQAQTCTPAVPATPSAKLSKEIASRNAQLTVARATGDVAGMMRHFAPDSVVMPEHQQRLFGFGQAHGYYDALFTRLGITDYSADTADIVPLETGALEWGTFELAYAPISGADSQTVEGKYLHLWQWQEDGTLKLKAEVWGFLAPLGDAAAHWIVGAPSVPTARPVGDPTIGAELDALNRMTAEAVRTYSTSRIGLYAPDAVYLPFADRPQVGLPAIREHLEPYIEAGRGASFDSVRVWNEGFEAIGGYIVEYSNFEVRWRAGEASGTTSGDGLRLWRREADCSLSLLREGGTHHTP